MNLECLNGWYSADHGRIAWRKTGYVCLDLDYPGVLGIELDTGDGIASLNREVPLAVVANVLRSAGWTVIPPTPEEP